MNDTHPDIKIGEPIPKIEPRINQDLFEFTCNTIRWSRWFLGFAVILLITLNLLHVNMFVSVGIYFGILTIWVIPAFRAKKKMGLRKRDQWSIPLRRTIELQIFVLPIALLSMTATSDGFDSFFSFFGAITLSLGLSFVYYSRSARQPGQICCKQCEYPLAGLTLPSMCPECGQSILDPTYTTDRPRVHWPALTWSGPALILFGLAIALTGVLRPGIFYAPMPRAALLALAPTDGKAFKQLIQQRPLTPTETTDLIDRVIESNMSPSGWPYDAHEQGMWLGACLDDGSINNEQIDRIMHQIHPVFIDAPTTAKVGQPIELRLTKEQTRLPGPHFNYYIFFGGFVIGDDPTTHGQSTQLHFPASIYSDPSWKEFQERYTKDIPKHTFTPTHAGTITIRAHLVFFTPQPGVRMANPPFAWNEDGQGTILTPSVWSQTRDIETTITITP